MYKVYVKSPLFQGLTRVKQHQLVAQTIHVLLAYLMPPPRRGG